MLTSGSWIHFIGLPVWVTGSLNRNEVVYSDTPQCPKSVPTRSGFQSKEYNTWQNAMGLKIGFYVL